MKLTPRELGFLILGYAVNNKLPNINGCPCTVCVIHEFTGLSNKEIAKMFSEYRYEMKLITSKVKPRGFEN